MAAFRAPSGPHADHFLVTGMTMWSPNPLFVLERERYAQLVREMQVHQQARDVARTRLFWSERATPYGCFVVPRFNADMELREVEIANILDTGTYIEKPLAVSEDRDRDIRAQLLRELHDDETYRALIDAIVEEERAKQAGANPPIVLDAEAAKAVREKVRVLAEHVRDQFTESVNLFNWYDTPLTSDELKAVFVEYCALVNAGVERAPRSLSFSTTLNEDQRREYIFATIEALPVTEMSAWATECTADKSAVVQRTVTTAVASLLVGRTEEAKSRSKALQTTAQRTADFVATVLDVVRLEARINKLGAIPAGMDDATLDELRALQAARMHSVNPTEEALRVRLFRLKNVATGVKAEAEARLERVHTALSRLRPTYETARVEERSVDDTSPFTFAIEVVPQEGAPDDTPTIEYTYTLHHLQLNGIDEAEPPVLVRSSARTFTHEVRVNGDAANLSGLYYAKVERRDTALPADAPTTLYSVVASVHVFATCMRCDETRFEVGVPRTFGECTWRAHADRSKRLARVRNDEGFKDIASRLGFVTARNGYRAALDDSITNDAGGVLQTDAELLTLANVPKDVLRNRYFTYEAVVFSAVRRAKEPFTEVLGENIYTDRVFYARMLEQFGFTEKNAPAAIITLAAMVKNSASIDEIPLIAMLIFLLDRRKSTVEVGESTHRFLSSIAENVAMFIQLYRTVEREYVRDDDILALTANIVRQSRAWLAPERTRFVFGEVTGHSMFIDEIGEARLQHRLTRVLRMYDFEQAEQRTRDALYSDATVRATLSLDTQEALVQPFGVPLSVWLEAQRRIEHAASGPVLITTAPVYDADWRGVHSYKTSDPDFYVIHRAPDKTASIERRGSERLRAGYDFPGLHVLIEQAVLEYNRDKTVSREKHIILLITYFMVLSLFAPVLLSDQRTRLAVNAPLPETVLPARVLEQRLTAILGPIV